MKIQLEHICKAFDGQPVLQDFCAVLEDGGTYALMGPSGAGKTTVLRMIAGLEQPDAGTLKGTGDLRVCMMFQEDRLLEYLDTVRNIRFVCPQIKPEQIVEFMQRLGICEEDCFRPVGEFSGGMKRRAALARALLSDGRILLLDEPLKGLDEESARRAAGVILEERGNRTLVFSTHTLWEAEFLKADIIQVPGTRQNDNAGIP